MAPNAGAVRRYRLRTASDPDDGRPIENAVYAAKTIVGPRPNLGVWITRVRRPWLAFRDDTDVVIEGYPKSANQFVAHAFQVAQPRQLQVAHTTHVAGQVIAACRRGIPALVLIRDAAEAVSRIALVRPNVSLELLLRGWIRFYRPLLPWRSRFALGPFPAVTGDLGAVITAMNRQLGTAFTPFDHTPENEREAFEAIEKDWATRIDPSAPEFDVHAGTPSPHRDALTTGIEEKLRSPRYAALLAQAADLERTITDG
jgi:hypothetical protein